MLTRTAIRCLLVSMFVLAMVPSPGFGQAKPSQAPSKEPKGTIVIQVRARDGGVLAQGVRDRIRSVPNVGRAETYLDGKTTEGVQVVGVEPGSTLQFRSGNQVLAAAIVQARGFEVGDASEAMVVGKTFAQNNKTALGLSIPAMLTRDHFPPIIVGGQGFAIIGIYATGDPKTDDQVLTLLATAQKLLKQPGRLSGVYVTPNSPAAADQVARDLRRALGDTVEVTPLSWAQR
jgi:ABC-type lipoprotein release transport system permease subunit